MNLRSDAHPRYGTDELDAFALNSQAPTPPNSARWELGVGSGWGLGVGRWEFASYASGAGSCDSPIKCSSMARAALRPSAIAHTMSDWPRCMSPAANTPGTLVIHRASRATF